MSKHYDEIQEATGGYTVPASPKKKKSISVYAILAILAVVATIIILVAVK